MASRAQNSEGCALTGVVGAELIRRFGDYQPIGEVYKAHDGWKAYAGYTLPTEFRGTWGLKTEAIFAINEADRLQNRGSYHGPI
jgi:hypothetical protein